MILTAISVLFFALQVFLLPVQLYSYLVLKVDKTRLRFLFLGVSIVSFNALWVLAKLYFDISPDVSSLILAYSGIFLVAHFYYYTTKELGLQSKKFSASNLLILLILTELLRDSSLVAVSEEFAIYAKFLFSMLFQTVAILYGSRLLRQLFANKEREWSPFENATTIALCIAMFFPVIIFHVKVTALYNLMINGIFLLIALAYFKHFIIKLKLEKRIYDQSKDLGNNLQEQFVRVPDTFFDYDLSAREREIAVYLLKGYSYEDIADKLHRTSGAMRKQGSKVYRKAGVKNLEQFRKKFEFSNGKITPVRNSSN